MNGKLARNAILVAVAMMLGLALGGFAKFGLGHSLAVEGHSSQPLASP